MVCRRCGLGSEIHYGKRILHGFQPGIFLHGSDGLQLATTIIQSNDYSHQDANLYLFTDEISDADPNAHGDSLAYSDANSHKNPYRNGNSHPDPYRYENAHAFFYAHQDAHPSSYPDAHGYGYEATDGYSDLDPTGLVYSNSDPFADTTSQCDSHHDSHGISNDDFQALLLIYSNTNRLSHSDHDLQPDTGAVPYADTVAFSYPIKHALMGTYGVTDRDPYFNA